MRRFLRSRLRKLSLQLVESRSRIKDAVPEPVSKRVVPARTPWLSRGVVQDTLELARRDFVLIPPAAQRRNDATGQTAGRGRAGVDAERVIVFGELTRGAEIRLLRAEP